MGKFERGNQFHCKRKHRRGGRPTKAQVELKKLVVDVVKKRLKEGLRAVVDAYVREVEQALRRILAIKKQRKNNTG